MRYSIDLPVGVLKSVADSDSFVSGWTRWSRGESHQRPMPDTARIDTPVPVNGCH